MTRRRFEKMTPGPKANRWKGCRLFWLPALALVLIAGGALIAYAHAVRSTLPKRNECVILLHGLYRSAASMTLIEHQLIRKGYTVINIDYASTRDSITTVAQEKVAKAVSRSKENGYARIHVVSHSLGALVIRSYLQSQALPLGSRIVMLAPPNQGSELADWAYQKFPRISRWSGPAANQLGTKDRAYATQLKPIRPEVGIIIGHDSWNPFFSKILPGADDGAVTVERAKLKEMRDFLVAPCNHTSILLNKYVGGQVLHFLRNGSFDHQAAR